MTILDDLDSAWPFPAPRRPQSVDWAAPPIEDAVAVVLAPVAGAAAYESLLDVADRERIARRRDEHDRQRFIAAHVLLRIVVGRILDAEPGGLRFTAICVWCGMGHGRPQVLGQPDLHLSLSHAGRQVAVAATRVGHVGVDVEWVAGTAFDGFGAAALAPGELVDGPEQRARLWVRKEAVLKASGYGLRVPPNALQVAGALEPAALVGWDADRAGAPSPEPVQLADVDVPDGYAAAVAVCTDSTLVVRRAAVAW